MKPLIVLIIAFVLSLLGIRLFSTGFDFARAGQIAMSVMLLFTAMGHFKFTKGMKMMLPAFIPFKITIVYLTGILEIAAAIGLFVSEIKSLTGWLLIVFFILILPANINAAVHKADYEKETTQGKGPAYLWFRIPLQILFIVWVYLSVIF